MQIEFGEQVVVAQSNQERHPWGVWQFPGIARLADDMLEATFSRTVDSASLDSAKKRYAPVAYVSKDNGRTWKQNENACGGRNACTLRNGTVIRLKKPPEMDAPSRPEPAVTQAWSPMAQTASSSPMTSLTTQTLMENHEKPSLSNALRLRPMIDRWHDRPTKWKKAVLRDRAKITSHFERRCIPLGCVAKTRNIGNIP